MKTDASVGGSTRLVQYAAKAFPDSLIISIQSYPMVAQRLAKRVASEFDRKDRGGIVGYHVGPNRKNSSHYLRGDVIMFVTDAVFIQEFSSEHYSQKSTVIIIDDAHERSLNTDLVLGLTKILLGKRKDDLHVVLIIERHIDHRIFSTFFEDRSKEFIEIRRDKYQVAVEYLPPPADCPSFKQVELHVIPTLKSFCSRCDGTILVFLPNQRDIEISIQLFNKNLPKGYIAMPFYETLPENELTQVFDFSEEKSGQKLVIFCTAILERAFTLKNVKLVIDAGITKQHCLDEKTEWTIFETVRVSRFVADLRKDAAGSIRNGHCVRLYKEDSLKQENILPEIVYAPLDSVILQLKSLSFDLSTFPFITEPKQSVVDITEKHLKSLDFTKSKGELTTFGRIAARLQIDARLSALMIKIFTEEDEHDRLLQLVATISAIMTAPGSIFLTIDEAENASKSIHNTVMLTHGSSGSDLIIFHEIFDKWKSSAPVDQSRDRCSKCKKSTRNSTKACTSCRTEYAISHDLNYEVLQLIEGYSEFFTDTICDSSWNLRPGKKSLGKNANDSMIIGHYLRKVFPSHIGHLIVSTLPDQGIHLLAHESRANLSSRTIYSQRIFSPQQQYFVALRMTSSISGKILVEHLHRITEDVPKSPFELLFSRSNVGQALNKQIKAVFNANTRGQPWAHWLVYDYDEGSCQLSIWGKHSESSRIQSMLKDSFKVTDSRTIELGTIRASFKKGLVCESIEFVEESLQINLHRVPCQTFGELQAWLAEHADVRRGDLKENNFQESRKPVKKHDRRRQPDSDDDDNKRYEAPPFYILLETLEAYKRAKAKLPKHFICPKADVIASTTGTHMDEKDAWGRQIVLTVPPGQAMTDKDLLKQLGTHVLDCRQFGKRVRNSTWKINLVNLPRDIDENTLRQIVQPVNPSKISIKQTHSDGTGSASAYIFFQNDTELQQTVTALNADYCQKQVQISIRSSTNNQIVNKMITPTIKSADSASGSNMFLITAVNRESALNMYREIIPKMNGYLKVDSTATVTVTHVHLYPNFSSFVDGIAKKFDVQAVLQDKGSNVTRCFFNQGTPQKTALAATTLAQSTSPIIIRPKTHREIKLYDELFSSRTIVKWSRDLNLEVTKKDEKKVSIIIRGQQVNQGQLMANIGDYSDNFDQRYRQLDLSSQVANLFSPRKLGEIQMQQLIQKWSDSNCQVTYHPRAKTIIIYAGPRIDKKVVDNCENDVKLMLKSLSADDNAVRGRQKCVFCGKETYSANIFQSCGHAYCRCAASHLMNKIPLHCNYPKCKAEIEMDDIFEIFQEREELLKVCKLSIQSYLKAHSKKFDQVCCPTTSCEGLVKRSKGYQTCLVCGSDVCPSCLLIDDEFHQGRTCEERNKAHSVGEFIKDICKEAEKFARTNWDSTIPPIIRVDYNKGLLNKCPSLERFYKGVQALGQTLPPDKARGFFAYHGTAPASIKPICEHGFDPTKRSGQAYGPGEYFGVTSAVSHGYSVRGNTTGPFSMIIGFLMNCPQLTTHARFCHVMNNPTDWSHAFNVPVVVVSYGTQASCPSPFD